MIYWTQLHMDRTGWGPGPWKKELDDYLWLPAHPPYLHMVRRGPMGAFCGYVGVGPSHPYFGMEANEACDLPLSVHGGITWSSLTTVTAESAVTFPSFWNLPKEMRMFGFDCSHAGDVVPKMNLYKSTIPGFPKFEHVMPWGPDVYRTVDYTQNEVALLALQLWELEKEWHSTQQILPTPSGTLSLSTSPPTTLGILGTSEFSKMAPSLPPIGSCTPPPSSST